MIQAPLPAVVRSRAASLAGLLAGLLFLQLPGTASVSVPASGDRKRPWALAQGEAPPNPAVAQLQELARQAEALRAKGADAEAARLWQQIPAVVEKVLGPEHPDTATSLIGLAALHLAQAKAAAPPLALETRLNRQGLLAEIERRQALLKGSSPETRRLAEQLAGIDRLLASVSLPPGQRRPGAASTTSPHPAHRHPRLFSDRVTRLNGCGCAGRGPATAAGVAHRLQLLCGSLDVL